MPISIATGMPITQGAILATGEALASAGFVVFRVNT
jgi:hypothetical protein